MASEKTGLCTSKRDRLIRWGISAVAAGLTLLVLLLFVIISEPDGEPEAAPQIIQLDYVTIPNTPEVVKEIPRKRPAPPEPQKQAEVKQNVPESPLPALEPESTPSNDQQALPSLPGSHEPPAAVYAPPTEKSSGPVEISSAGELDNVNFQPLFNPPPDYPPIARSAGLEGFVDVELIIDESGRIESFSIRKASGHPAFGTETAKVIRKWRFPPPRIGGRAVKVKYVYKVKFMLN